MAPESANGSADRGDEFKLAVDGLESSHHLRSAVPCRGVGRFPMHTSDGRPSFDQCHQAVDSVASVQIACATTDCADVNNRTTEPHRSVDAPV